MPQIPGSKRSPGELLAALQENKSEDLQHLIHSSGIILDLKTATSIRDHAATFLATDPSHAYKISEILTRAVHHIISKDDHSTKAVVWRCRAEGCFFTGRLKAARSAYEKAAAEAELADNRGLLGQILVGRIALLALLGAFSESEKLVGCAEKLLRANGDLAYLAKLYMNLGNAAYHKEKYKEAFELYGRAADMFEEIGNRDATWIGLLINQAIACTNLSRIGEARKKFIETESFCDELSLDHLKAEAQYNRAFLEGMRGDYRAALSLLEEAGQTFDQSGSRDLGAATIRARAEIYLELGMAEEARELASAATQVFLDEAMKPDAVLTNIVEAKAQLLLHHPGDAEALLHKAEDYYATRRIRPRRAIVLLLLARTKLAQDRSKESRMFCQRALRTFRSQQMRERTVEALCLLAESYLIDNRRSNAENKFAEAVKLSTIIPARDKLELWALGGRIARSMGKSAEAKRRFRRAIRYLEAQRRFIPGIELRARAFDQQVRVYRDLIAQILESPRVSFKTIFPLIEASRARGFRERIDGGIGIRDEGITDERVKLGSLVRRLEEITHSDQINRIAEEQLRRKIRSMEKEIERDSQRLQTLEPETRPLLERSDPEEIANNLRSDEVILEYFISGDSIIALLLSRNFRVLRRLPTPASKIQTGVESINLQLETMAVTVEPRPGRLVFLRSTLESTLMKLYSLLFVPLEDLLKDFKRIKIVPHDFLHRLPFECLFDGEAYLDQRWLISRLPTADFRWIRGRGRRRKNLTIVIAGTIEAGPKFVESEISAVASAFSEGEVRLLRNPTAQLLLKEMQVANIIHLTTHGVFRKDNPAFSRLSMKGQSLFLADILETRLEADLVVLSACDTGSVFSGQGDDLSGLAHGFLAAGARCLVASSWRVHDESTKAFMTSFHEKYLEDARRDPVRALTQAAQSVRKKWNHPFYWGAFSIHGF